MMRDNVVDLLALHPGGGRNVPSFFHATELWNKDESVFFQFQDGVELEETKEGFSWLLFGNLLVQNQLDNKVLNLL